MGGGILATGMTVMLTLSIANIFMGSKLLYSADLYLGLVVMCGCVLYDTQLIVEKIRRGDDDFIWHCVDLFLAIVAVCSSSSLKRKKTRTADAIEKSPGRRASL